MTAVVRCSDCVWRITTWSKVDLASNQIRSVFRGFKMRVDFHFGIRTNIDNTIIRTNTNHFYFAPIINLIRIFIIIF